VGPAPPTKGKPEVLADKGLFHVSLSEETISSIAYIAGAMKSRIPEPTG
jgi:hypothetical protein